MSAAERFVRRLASVPETAMRRSLWREFFESADDDVLLEAVWRVVEGADRRAEAERVGFLALVEYLEELRGVDHAPRRRLYEAAKAARADPVMRLLLTSPRGLEADESDIRQPPTRVGQRELTLGERRALARKADHRTFDRLLHDPDPVVVQHLLQNPRLTEKEVLRIASRRPVAAATLKLVFEHPRWGHRPSVLRALVLNPFTPRDLAVRLLSVVDRETARDVARDPKASATMRARAQVMLLGRRERAEARRVGELETHPVPKAHSVAEAGAEVAGGPPGTCEGAD
jgi:hypothetical protein